METGFEYDPLLADYAVNSFFSLSLFKRQKATKFLMKVLSNIMENPDVAKYRSVNTGKLTEKLGMEVMNALLPIFQACGFSEQYANDGTRRLVLQPEDPIAVQIILATVTERVEQEESEMEAQRARIRDENAAKNAQANGAEARRKSAVKQRNQLGRQDYESERKLKPTEASKAKKIQFGRKTIPVEFQTGGPSGG